MGPARPTFEYLSVCSTASLESFELSRLDRASHLRGQLRDLIRQCVEAEVEASLARLVIEARRVDVVRDRQVALPASTCQQVPEQLSLALPSVNAQAIVARADIVDIEASNNPGVAVSESDSRSRIAQRTSAPLQLEAAKKCIARDSLRCQMLSRRAKRPQPPARAFSGAVLPTRQFCAAR